MAVVSQVPMPWLSCDGDLELKGQGHLLVGWLPAPRLLILFLSQEPLFPGPLCCVAGVPDLGARVVGGSVTGMPVHRGCV